MYQDGPQYVSSPLSNYKSGLRFSFFFFLSFLADVLQDITLPPTILEYCPPQVLPSRYGSPLESLRLAKQQLPALNHVYNPNVGRRCPVCRFYV